MKCYVYSGDESVNKTSRIHLPYSLRAWYDRRTELGTKIKRIQKRINVVRCQYN